MVKAFWVLLSCLLVTHLPIRADTIGGFPDLPVQYYRLRNGLRVILCTDPSLPIVSVVVAYGAGSVREKEGQAGLAYFLENMMFQGSENVGPLQHIGFIQKIGGELNAQTRFEKTVFYQTLPSNQLGLALWLESDRMRSLTLSPSSVEKVRQELLSDLESRKATDPYFFSWANFDALLFPDYLYGHAWLDADDIRTLSLEDVRDFYRTYYIPNNAILCITGNIQFTKARELVARYFDSVPPGPDVPSTRLPGFGQVSEVATGDLIPPGKVSPGFMFGYRLYPLEGRDYYAAKILEYVLMKGKTSRLYNRLIRKDMSAFSLEGWLEERGRSSALKMIVINRGSDPSDRAKRSLVSEFEKLKTTPVSETELSRAKRLFKADFMRRLASRMERATILIDLVWLDRSPDSFPAEFERYMQVERQDLIDLANHCLVPQNRIVFSLGEN